MIDNNQSCKVKCGLLFLHDCNKPVVAQCKACNRPVCKNHSVTYTMEIICPDCAAGKPELRKKTTVNRVRRRNRYYNDWDYFPFYYGTHMYFSDHDYRSFEDQNDFSDDYNSDMISDENNMQDDSGFDDDADSYMES